MTPWPITVCFDKKISAPKSPEIPLSAISSASRKLKCMGMLLSLYLNFAKFAQFGGQEMYQKTTGNLGWTSDFLGVWNAYL